MIDTSEAASEEYKQAMRGKLDALLSLAESTHCRRASLLSYFGEELKSKYENSKNENSNDLSGTETTNYHALNRSESELITGGSALHAGNSIGVTSYFCGNCDNCLNPPAVWDATEAARKMLSCIYRVHQASGISFGAGHLMDILRGKTTEKVLQYGHERLSTFGIGADVGETQWRAVLRQLITKDMVRVDTEAFNTLQLLPEARQVLKGLATVLLREQLASSATPGKRSKKAVKTSAKGIAEAALNAGALERLAGLKEWRAEIAREHNLPAFVIFHDSTLCAIAERSPVKLSDLEGIAGIGVKKLEAYGAEVLRVCAMRA
jgi:ATP-dependent DNA helicase RecQ